MTARRIAISGVILAVLIGSLAIIYYIESSAEKKARAFCSSFTIGSPFTDVATATVNKGDPKHRIIKPNRISIAYIGVPPFSRHVCVYEGEAGKVTRVRYSHVD